MFVEPSFQGPSRTRRVRTPSPPGFPQAVDSLWISGMCAERLAALLPSLQKPAAPLSPCRPASVAEGRRNLISQASLCQSLFSSTRFFFSFGSASALEAEDLGMLAHSAGCAGAALVKRAVNTSRFDSLVKGIFFGSLKIFRSSLISAECVAEPRVRRSHRCVRPTWAQRFGR